MPIPNPRKNEVQDKFMTRCMGNDTMKKEYPKNTQRLAVCFSSWRKVHGGKPPTEGLLMYIEKKIEKIREGLKSLVKQTEKRFNAKGVIFFEAFLSLRRELEQAVVIKFGKNTYLSDFSNKEVIVGFEREEAAGPSYRTDKYVKIGYKVTKGEVQFVGDPQEVERVTSYEGELTPCDFAEAYFANKGFEAKNNE